MSEKIHDRALHLIAQARVEGITEADSTWLRAHLEECEFCTGHACGWLAPFRGPSVSPVLRMFGACSSGSENVLEYRN